MIDVFAFWRDQMGSNSELVRLIQVPIHSPSMQPCTVYLGANRGDGLRQFITLCEDFDRHILRKHYVMSLSMILY